MGIMKVLQGPQRRVKSIRWLKEGGSGPSPDTILSMLFIGLLLEIFLKNKF